MKKIYVTQPLTPELKKYTTLLEAISITKIFSNSGIYVEILEDRLKYILDVKYLDVFCNGTTALMIALKSFNFESNTYVITTPFTFPATANVLVWNNLKPIFCDVDYDTMNITPELVEPHIVRHSYPSVSAIMPVHVFGNSCDVYGFKKLQSNYKEWDIKIIYDAAHAFGTEIDGKSIGTFGDITMFSFHPTKLFHTGEGGALAYGNKQLIPIIQQLRNFGIKDDQIGSVRPGINGKMNELQAALGICILEKIKNETQRRKIIYDLYVNLLSHIPEIKLCPLPKNVKNSFQYFPIRIMNGKRDIVHTYLEKNKIFARKYFYPLCSDFKHFKHLHSHVPNAVKISKEILCVPFYGDLTTTDIERICNLIKKGLKK